jgi:hypothetical protein
MAVILIQNRHLTFDRRRVEERKIKKEEERGRARKEEVRGRS